MKDFNILCLECDSHYFDFNFKFWKCSLEVCKYKKEVKKEKSNKFNTNFNK